jgi:predicted DNA binding CopG/RHH family protein
MPKPIKLKKLPRLKNDDEAEAFVQTADLTEYDLSGGQFVRFEMQPKDKAISLRLPEPLLENVRRKAKRAGIPYQRFIRLALERAVSVKS